jgi:uncharacterized protein YdeI (YjbR/CyaY-like superfamily)
MDGAPLTVNMEPSPIGVGRLQAWQSRLDHIDALVVPDDLNAALDALPPAAEHFGGFPPSIRSGILE